MHPSPSVIIFTALSGLGFGLLVFLGLKMPDVTGVLAFIFFVIGFGLAVGGLISSTFHLGRPERSLKAFKQWRSSWLSREAIAAVLTLSVMAVYAIGRIFFEYDIRILGVVGAILSVVTVFTTSMIYAQLKSIPRWNTKLTPAYFLSLSLAGGALLAGQITFCLLLLLISGIIQLLVWIKGDRALAFSGTTPATPSAHRASRPTSGCPQGAGVSGGQGLVQLPTAVIQQTTRRQNCGARFLDVLLHQLHPHSPRPRRVGGTLRRVSGGIRRCALGQI